MGCEALSVKALQLRTGIKWHRGGAGTLMYQLHPPI